MLIRTTAVWLALAPARRRFPPRPTAPRRKACTACHPGIRRAAGNAGRTTDPRARHRTRCASNYPERRTLDGWAGPVRHCVPAAGTPCRPHRGHSSPARASHARRRRCRGR
jgi:hypothetical protein